MLRLANVGNARGWPQRATRFAMGCAVAFVLHACADVAQLDLLARLVSLTCVMMLLSGAMCIVAGYRRVLRVRRAMLAIDPDESLAADFEAQRRHNRGA